MTNQIKAKVLLIPSWYPTKEKPLLGSFFREQALALMHLYDIRIFCPKRLEQGRLSRVLNTLLFYLRIKPSIEFEKDNLANYPHEFAFNYKGGIGLLKLEEKLLEWNCNTAYEKLIETGWKPDLIHAQCTTLGGIISYFISKKAKIPYIITEHNVFLLHLYTTQIQALMKSALENAKIVLSVSEHQKRMILMHDISCSPIVVGNMIDENIFFISNNASKIFTIIHITFETYIKDSETFFKAIKMFQNESIEPFKVNVLVSGLNADPKRYFLGLVKKYGLESFVQIIVNVERDKIAAYFQDSDVFVSTSIAETFGVSMCEALFCGIPIISTANGGVDDMINQQNGFKVNIQDAEAICGALIKIKNKEVVFDKMEIRNSVITKFSKAAFVKRVDKIFCSALE